MERGSSAVEALDVITQLLETYGQGGACFIDPSRQGITYHNSFIIADPVEAWVLETVGKHWAAEKCTGLSLSYSLSPMFIYSSYESQLELVFRTLGFDWYFYCMVS